MSNSTIFHRLLYAIPFLSVHTKCQRNVLLKHKTKHLPWNPVKWLGANYVRVLLDGWNGNLFDKTALSHTNTLRFSHVLEHITHTYYVPIPFEKVRWKILFDFNIAQHFWAVIKCSSSMGLTWKATCKHTHRGRGRGRGKRTNEPRKQAKNRYQWHCVVWCIFVWNIDHWNCI